MSTEMVAGCMMERRGSGTAIVCLPAFGDSARSWDSLSRALSDGYEVAVVELPGVNRPGRLPVAPAVTAIADLVAQVVSQTWAAPVTLVGHSFGSVVAVRAAQRLDRLCRAVVSVEGNLTVHDAYLTGLAAQHDDPAAFHASLVTHVERLVGAGQAPVSYAESLGGVDAATLWAVGLDVVRESRDDRLGHEFLGLSCARLYLWSRATTPPATQAFLSAHAVPSRELQIGHHWPWVVDPGRVAALIGRAADGAQARGTLE
jgi:pimeloyl-ACP methyl ester carboxylesterase